LKEYLNDMLSIRIGKKRKLKLAIIGKIKNKSMSKIVNELIDDYINDKLDYIENFLRTENNDKMI